MNAVLKSTKVGVKFDLLSNKKHNSQKTAAKCLFTKYFKIYCVKEVFIICRQDDMIFRLLFRTPSLLNAYTTAVNSFKHSLQTGLLQSNMGCALFYTSLVN